jgi:hypothetical protein
MDYIELINTSCPVEIQRSVAQLEQGVTGAKEDDAFFPFSGKPLDRGCLHAMTRYLAKNVRPHSSASYKLRFFSTAMWYASASVHRIDDEYNLARTEVGEAMDRLMDDVSDESSLGSGIVGTLAAYRIDRRDAILARVRYDQPGLQIWEGLMFNEYALVMGDDTAEARIAHYLATATGPELRVEFERQAGLAQKNALFLPASALERLVRPYINDGRVTHEVDGDGPPVSHYARLLLDAL